MRSLATLVATLASAVAARRGSSFWAMRAAVDGEAVVDG